MTTSAEKERVQSQTPMLRLEIHESSGELVSKRSNDLWGRGNWESCRFPVLARSPAGWKVRAQSVMDGAASDRCLHCCRECLIW